MPRGGLTQLTNTPALYKSGIAFSPSGKQIAFTRTDPGQQEAIFVMKADGTEVTRLDRPKRDGERPGGRPDDHIEGTARFPSATITAEPPSRTATTLAPSRSHSTCMRLGRPLSQP
jgi:hypothetical protein